MEKEEKTFYLIKLIPNMLTMSALCMGLFAIRMAIIENYKFAVICIAIACFLDTIDGRVARKLNVSSDIGAQLDSLADFLNFGIAPGFIMYFWKMDEFNKILGLGWIPVLVLAVCMAIRLARFNVGLIEKDPNDPLNKYFFQGVPAPMAALFVLVPLILSFEYNICFIQKPLFVIINTIISGLLAALPFPTPCVKKVKISVTYKYLILLFFTCLFIMALFKPWLTFVFIYIVYIISIFVGWKYYFLFKKNKQKV